MVHMEQQFNYLVYKLKLMGFSVSEIKELFLNQAKEYILHYEAETNLKHIELLAAGGIDAMGDKGIKRYKEFFKSYEQYFSNLEDSNNVKKIDPTPKFLEG